MRVSDRVAVDDDRDSVFIDGFRISMGVFEDLILTPTPEGRWFRVKEANKNTGLITIETRLDEERQA